LKDEPCVEESSERIEKSEIIRFAKTLLSLVKDNQKRDWFEERGIRYEDHRKNNVTVSRWQQGFLALVFRELTNGNEFIEFLDEVRGTPTYEMMEYKRGVSDSLPVEGYSWTKTKDATIILEIDYSGYNCWINAYHNLEDHDEATALLQKIKKDVESMDLLRGEKLLITSGNRIKFFHFKHTTREHLVLPEKIWTTLEKNLFFFLEEEELLKKNKLEWRRGILIWGPPGTGKTLLGKYLCSNLDDVTILWVTPKCVRNSEDVEKLFDMGRILAPTIIFIEDLDFFAADRDQHGLHPILGELLTQLDGISSNDGVFVVGTTNNQRILDKAIASRPSRFDVRMEIGLPELQERIRLFTLFLGTRKIENYSLLATRSNEFSAAHVKEACVRGILSMLGGATDLEKCVLAGIDELREEELNRPPPTGPIS